MHKFPIFNYKRYSELPFEEMDKQRFAIYIIDFNWKYLFANVYAFSHHDIERDTLTGDKLWKALQERMEADTQFKTFIKRLESGYVANVVTLSSFSKKRVSVTGYPLEDCYYFAVTVLPEKENLMDELRAELLKKKSR